MIRIILYSALKNLIIIAFIILVSAIIYAWIIHLIKNSKKREYVLFEKRTMRKIYMGKDTWRSAKKYARNYHRPCSLYGVGNSGMFRVDFSRLSEFYEMLNTMLWLNSIFKFPKISKHIPAKNFVGKKKNKTI